MAFQSCEQISIYLRWISAGDLRNVLHPSLVQGVIECAGVTYRAIGEGSLPGAWRT